MALPQRRMIIEVEASDLILDTLKSGLADSARVTIVPESMYPGFVVTFIRTEESP